MALQLQIETKYRIWLTYGMNQAILLFPLKTLAELASKPGSVWKHSAFVILQLQFANCSPMQPGGPDGSRKRAMLAQVLSAIKATCIKDGISETLQKSLLHWSLELGDKELLEDTVYAVPPNLLHEEFCIKGVTDAINCEYQSGRDIQWWSWYVFGSR